MTGVKAADRLGRGDKDYHHIRNQQNYNVYGKRPIKQILYYIVEENTCRI
jgi:hypothetical protein